MSMTLNRGNGTKKIQWKQQKRIAIQKSADLDLHVGVKLIGLSTAKESNVNSDFALCKLDSHLI